MKLTIKRLERIQTMVEWATAHRLNLVVEQQSDILWRAAFEGVTLQQDSHALNMKSLFGTGTTVEMAIEDYCRRLRGQEILLGGITKISVPQFEKVGEMPTTPRG